MARRRVGSITAVAVLSLLAAIALWWARDTDQYAGNLLLNIGASFVGAVVTYALVNPLMARQELRAEKIFDNFNHNRVIEHIHDAKHTVRIFETGIALLDDLYLERFLDACNQALACKVKIEILLLDPDCRAAEQRADELRHSTTRIRELIRQNLLALHRYRSRLDEERRQRLEVRVYATAPVAAYYRWDGRALISFFPTNRSSENTSQYETSAESSFAQFVEQRFEESWAAPNTYSLERYFAMPIIIRRLDDDPFEAEWVVRGNDLYLAHRELAEHVITRGGTENVQVELRHVEPWSGEHGLGLCQEDIVHSYFEGKYGSSHRRTMFTVKAP
ncbi:hypothetical protein [Pseudonocardia spinosispora]|uniref:hypothetical protein n=1 Tax=Pseudonocardia spinosispora TaxID=103441 RepID=UPI00048F20A2|nr:hypothetical protein [Pseudonocardia spinosispora]